MSGGTLHESMEGPLQEAVEMMPGLYWRHLTGMQGIGQGKLQSEAQISQEAPPTQALSPWKEGSGVSTPGHKCQKADSP